MNDEDRDMRRRHGELIGALERLGGLLDGQRYPGRAWPVERRRRISLPGVIFRLTFGAAVAAGVLLAVAAAYWLAFTRTVQPTAPGKPPVVKRVQPPEKSADQWPIPTDVDVSMAAQVRWALPTAPLPSAERDPNTAERVDWSIPAAAFPTLKDLAEELERDVAEYTEPPSST